MKSIEKTKLLVNISKMYYEQNRSQQEIADRVNLSRTYVGKLLIEARERGIVEIKVFDPLAMESELEEGLRKRYGLRKAIVVPVDDCDPQLIEKLGQVAAQYFSQIVQSGDTVGVSWGATLHAFSQCVQQRTDLQNVNVSPLCGGISKIEDNVYTSEIPANIAQRLGGNCYLIPAPAVLDSVGARNAVVKDRAISQVLEIAGHADIAVFTVGVFDAFSAFVRAGYFTGAEMGHLVSKGAVGDICSHIIDANGRLCDSAMEKRTVAVSYETILQIPTRMGIAAHLRKFQCVKAALGAGCFHVFVTNEPMAAALLQ